MSQAANPLREHAYRELVQACASVSWVCDARGHIVEPQAELEAYCGLSFAPADGISGYGGMDWLAAVYAEDRDTMRVRCLDALRRGVAIWLSVRLFHAASGSHRRVAGRLAPLGTGEPREWAVMLMETEEQVTAEPSASATEWLALAAEAGECGIFSFDLWNGAGRSSQHHRQILGLPLDREPSVADFIQRVHEDDRHRVCKAIERALPPQGTGRYELEYRIHDHDGSTRWIATTGRARTVEVGGERVIRIAGTVYDITDKTRTQNELERRCNQQAALSEFGLLALRQPDLQLMLEHAVHLVALTLRVPLCEIVELDPAAAAPGRFTALGWPGPEDESKPGGLDWRAAIERHAAWVAASNQRIVLGHTGRELLDRNGLTDPELADYGVVNSMSVIVSGPRDEAWGVLTVHATDPREFTDDDVSFVQAVANVLTATIVHVCTDAALREAKLMAEHASAAKDRLLAILGHELRTPLTPVLAAISAMERDPTLGEAVREEVQLIRRNIELEARLLDDLLELTRLHHGQLELEPRPYSARALLEQARELCSADAEAKHLAIVLELTGGDRPIHVDPRRALQIFRSLLGNAIKYTPAGQGPIILRSQPTSTRRLRIDIIDAGIGMNDDLLRRAFEAFEQGASEHGDGDQQRGGLGLGLAIARELVIRHGGSISALSPGPGCGTTIRVELPLAARDATVPAPSSRPTRVLLIEDHEDTADVLSRVLERRGMSVVTAPSGKKALAAARAHPFDVVLSDIGLPDMPGYELFALLRQEHPALVGIAISGFGTEGSMNRCRDAGFQAYLTKPIDIDRLEHLILRHAGMSRA